MLCSSLIFQRIFDSKYFKNNQKIIIGQLWVFQKLRIKKPTNFGYFKNQKQRIGQIWVFQNLQRMDNFMKELVNLFHFF
jgi:hypothetical protein